MVVDNQQLLKSMTKTHMTLSTMTNFHDVVNDDEDSACPCPPLLMVTTRTMNLSNWVNLPSLYRLFDALCHLPPTTTG
jgi:hypothetical protein